MRMTRRQFGIRGAAALGVATSKCKGMSMTSNLNSFRAIIERGFCHGDLTVADEMCDEKMIEHEYLAKADLPGPRILKSQIEEARRSISDLQLTVEAFVESADTIWARSKARGVDPRSGKPIAIDVIDICRFKDGKLVEHWGVPDRFALLHQMGALSGLEPPK